MNNTSISSWLRKSALQLRSAAIDSGRLDAEIILAHTLRKSRTYLHAHLENNIAIHALEIADARLQLRLDRTPIAYIIGHKEFYGRSFIVTPSTLIPRPESEDIVTLLKEIAYDTHGILSSVQPRLIDVGTGSGCLGITAKLELPKLEVTLSDTSQYALQVARKNAQALDASVSVQKSDLLKEVDGRFDYIIANLPYVDHSWQRSPETNHEPAEALFADDNGLQLIYKLLVQAADSLTEHGTLLLEADTRQHRSIIERATEHHYSLREIRGFIVALQHDAEPTN